MRWAHLITPMCQILNVVITSCISFVLVHFYYLICCFIFVIFLSGHDRLRPNEMNLAPNLGRCAAHLGGTALRLLDKYIHLPQGSKLLNFFFFLGLFLFLSSFFFNLSVLPYFKPVNASEWEKKKRTKTETNRSTVVLIVREGASDTWTFLKISGQAACPRGTTSQVFSRLLRNIFL